MNGEFQTVTSSIKSLPTGRLFAFQPYPLGKLPILLLPLLFVLMATFPAMEVQADDQTSSQNAGAIPAPVSFTIGAFPFIRPSEWKWVIPSSAMRKVQLAIVSGEGRADVSFFTFGEGEGGTIQANVERWAKQFSSPEGTPVTATTESRTIASVPVTFVSARGTFSAGMMDNSSTPSPGYALRGAIIESPTGSTGSSGDIFIKMTGPEKLVLKASPAFDAMITKACQEAVSP